MSDELVALVGGTGLGDALAGAMDDAQYEDVRTPFGAPSGPVMLGRIGRRRVAFINRHGAGHIHNPSTVPYAANVFALKKLGARTLIAGGAVGSLSEDIAPGDLVLVDQFIDKTFRRRGTFFDDCAVAHCEFADPTCRRLRGILSEAAASCGLRAHDGGTYVCMEGPQFSSRAESLMHRAWGGDLIGMTAMPEAKLAREAQMCYGLVALVSDYDCWRPHTEGGKQRLLEEILGNLKRATDNCLQLIQAVLGCEGAPQTAAGNPPLVCETCACRRSLELAVWTAPDAINPQKRNELAVLFE